MKAACMSGGGSQRRIGIVLGYANILAKNLVNLIYTPMLLAFVGQADYGVYQSCSSFVLSLALLSFGFSLAYVRFYTRERIHGTKEGVGRLNGVYLVLYSVVSVVALALGLTFAANADAIFSVGFTVEQIAEARAVMAVLAGNIAITLFNSVFDAYILAHEEFCFQQTRQLATTLAAPFIACALLFLGMGVVGVALAQLAVSVLLLLLNGFFCMRRLEMSFDVHQFDWTLFKSIAAFSVWIFANQICDLVNQNVPNILLGALTSASAVAVFAVSVQIRTVFISLSTTISNVFTPKINQIVAETNNNSELTELMARVGRYQMILFCWVYGGFAILGEFFVKHWAGEGFADAYQLILVMTLPLAVSLSQNTGIEIQRAKNKHRTRSVAMLATAAFNVAFTAATSPCLGYWAPAIAYFVGELLCKDVFMNWYYQKRIGLNMAYFWRVVLPAVGAGVLTTVVCFVGVRFLPVNNWLTFIAWGVMYTALFGCAIWFIVLVPREKARILSMVKTNRGN